MDALGSRLDTARMMPTEKQAVRARKRVSTRSSSDATVPLAQRLTPVAAATIWRGHGRAGALDGEGPRLKPKLVWRSSDVEISGDEWGGFPVEAGGLVTGGTGAHLAAVDAKTGEKIWQHKTSPSQSWPLGQAAVADGVVCACSKDGMFALDQQTGVQRWLWKASKIQGSPLINDGVAYVASKNAVNAVDLVKGRKRWTCVVNSEVTAPIAFAGGVLFVTTDDALIAVEAADGKRTLWQQKVSGGGVGPVLAGGLVLARGAEPDEFDTVIAFEQTTGEVVWKSHFGEETAGLNRLAPIAAANGQLFVRDGNDALHALNAATGQRQWVCAETATALQSDGAMVVAAGVIYAIIKDVVAVAVQEGKLLWRLRPEDIIRGRPIGFKARGSVAIADGTLFVPMYDGLVALR